MRGLVPGLLAVACAGFASASHAQEAGAPLAAAYTDLSPRLCGVASRAPENAGAYSCRGVAGVRIDVASVNGVINATMSWRNAPVGRPQITASRKIGDRVEWLGRREGREFEPLAAIVRVTNDEDGRPGVLLEVLRVSSDTICAAGFVDTSGTPRPNEAARQLAGEVATGFRCGVDQPRIVGPATTLARGAMERLG